MPRLLLESASEVRPLAGCPDVFAVEVAPDFGWQQCVTVADERDQTAGAVWADGDDKPPRSGLCDEFGDLSSDVADLVAGFVDWSVGGEELCVCGEEPAESDDVKEVDARCQVHL